MNMNKETLRKIYLEKRLEMSEDDLSRLSLAISDLFFASFDLSKSVFLHLFLPLKKRKEINTMFILKRINEQFPEVKIVVSRSDFDKNSLEHVLHKETTVLIENKYGIPEPSEGEIIDEKKIDLVLIPLLVFDRQGNRIGYGKGFYDRFLAMCRPDVKKIGLSFEDPVEKILPDKFDVPLDFCITPHRIYNFV
jgi:5-formyltetrahydrofolate cyclo-ligase